MRRLLIVVALIVAPPVLGRLGLLNGPNAITLGFALTFGAAAIGLNVVMGYAGQISLGHAAFLGIGAYTSAILTGRAGWSFLAGAFVAALAGGFAALIIGLVSLRIRGLYLAISTLAFGVAVFEGLFKTQALSGGTPGAEPPRPVAGTFIFSDNADYLALVMAILLLVWHLDRNIVRTKLGRAFHAIREDEDVAATLGVDVAKYKTAAFVLAGAFTGIAGAAYAPLTSLVQPDNFPFSVSISFIIIVVVGGLGSRVGVFTAAAAFSILPAIVDKIPALDNVEFFVGAVLLIITLVRHPGGLAQAFLEARERKERVESSGVMASLPAPAGGSVVTGEGPMLSVRDLGVSFGGLQAVQDAGFDVGRGKIVGLIGPNGAGKTTCFNAISGLVRPDSGRITFAGHDITSMPTHKRAALGMGRTFQLLGLARNLTVTENLLLAQHRLASYAAPESLGYTPRVARVETTLGDSAREALSALGFERFAETPLRNLSHGQQRLVELASALITSPEILLLDEPSGGMAPNAAESLAERLIEVRDKLGRTVLLIEHHIPLVMAVCDEIHVLASGSILASGTPAQIVRNPLVAEAYLGTAAGVVA